MFDHATPIGDVVVAAPTYFRLEASFHGKAAHAGIRPEDGRSAVLAAALAIAAMPLGRIDAQTTANVARSAAARAPPTSSPSAAACSPRRARSTSRVEDVVAASSTPCTTAPPRPSATSTSCEKLFTGFKVRPSAPELAAAEAALRACGYEPRRIQTGGGLTPTPSRPPASRA